MRCIILIFILVVPFATKAQIITTVAGGGTSGLGDGGPATAATIGWFGTLCFDSIGNCYIGDGNNYRVRRVDTNGVITTIAGTGIHGFNGDGIAATTANLDYPTYVGVDIHNNLLIADTNSRIRIVNLQTGIINTFAGSGVPGFSGDSGLATAAKIRSGPIAADHFGNVYIGDGANFRIRKVNAAGIISTVCGTGIEGTSGNGGPITAAVLNYQLSLCTDAAGNLYFNDNNTNTIRKIDFSTGLITQFAGDGVGGPFNGDGIPATAANINPVGVAVDAAGNIYIADDGNARIREVNNAGNISTIAGNGIDGYSGDNGPATTAEINKPEGVALDHCNNVYVADYANKRVRKVAFNPYCWPSEVPQIAGNQITIYPNPVLETLYIDNVRTNARYSLFNITGIMEQTGILNPGSNTLNLSGYAPGMYLIRLKNENGEELVRKLVKL